MKFNKELAENAVPEWRVKYLDYKNAKKKLKAVAKGKKLKAVGRAVRSVDRSPQKTSQLTSSLRDGPVYSFLRGRGWISPNRNDGDNARRYSELASSVWERQDDLENATASVPVPGHVDERSPLLQHDSTGPDPKPQMMRYGSIIGSPPGRTSPVLERVSTERKQVSLLELPDPALAPASNEVGHRGDRELVNDRAISPGSVPRASQSTEAPRPLLNQRAGTGDVRESRQPGDVRPASSIRSGLQSALRVRRTSSLPTEAARMPLVKRVLSAAGGAAPSKNWNHEDDVALEAYREFDFRKAEFFYFLDGELEKIESFYKEREDEAKERLEALREQLHILRDMRLQDIESATRRKKGNYVPNGDTRHSRAEAIEEPDSRDEQSQSRLPIVEHLYRYRNSVAAQVDDALDKVRTGHIGQTAKAMRELGTPVTFARNADAQDYTRRFPQQAVTYSVGKRKLKHAFVEYYRSLELLKSYRLLNHTAFRKITKKCDKTMPGHSGADYFRDKVNKAYFVSSDVLDVLMLSAEDYYARYFERGSQYAARSYFRQPGCKSLNYDRSMLRAGLFLGIGLAFAINGLIAASKDTRSSSEVLAIRASYLLQVYAGFFLCLFFLFMFCIACREWRRYKVNYVLIFELNQRHNMDWRQLAEFGALFMLYLGLIMSMNFDWLGAGSAMYTYWPAVMLAVTGITIFLPLPIWYHRSRVWFVQSFSRLLFSGIYPVEFRDLFIGDLFCSMTYVFGNVELFFCLYHNDWNNPPQCNSSNSILFAFFTTVPGIMRAAQCFRRFAETGDKFPHLVNFGKYCCTIGMYATLGAYRLTKTWEGLIAFCVAASINSIYCIIWDVIIDWSLGSTTAKWPLLRKELLLGHIWWYYFAIIVDPILRCNWVLYVIFLNDDQHSTLVSFIVALTEVFRRGFWAVFRVENEQTSFNQRLLASRRPSLPFAVPETVPEEHSQAQTGPSPVSETLRRVGSAMTSAHAQDYVRKRVPAGRDGPADEDDDDDDD